MKKLFSTLFVVIILMISVISASAAASNQFVFEGDTIQYSVYIEPLDITPVGMQMDIKFNNDALDIITYDYSNIPSAVANFNSNDDGTIRVNNSTLEGMDFSSKTTLISVEFIVTQKTSVKDIKFDISVPCLYDIDLVDIENFVVDDEIEIIPTNIPEEETSAVVEESSSAAESVTETVTETSEATTEPTESTSKSDSVESVASTINNATSDESDFVDTGDTKNFYWGLALIFLIVTLIFGLTKFMVVAKLEK